MSTENKLEVWITSRIIKNQKTFVARYHDEAGKVHATRNLKTTSKRAAMKAAKDLLPEIMEKLEKKHGAAPSPENPLVLPYLKAFWSHGSDYQERRRLRGVNISVEYMKGCKRAVELHAASYLENKRILDLGQSTLETMVVELSRKGVSPQSINATLKAIRVPCADFCRMHHLPNLLQGVQKLRENLEERGSLSQDEMKALIAIPDLDPRCRASIILAGLCGLRAGEIRGLWLDDLDEAAGIINVRHNFVGGEGAKAPKCGSARTVPCPKIVLDACRALSPIRPRWYTGPYVFFNARKPNSPIALKTLERGFYAALARIGIDETVRKKRRLVYHSLRHAFVSLSRSAGVPDFIVQRMAGHSTLSMTDRYSHASLIDFASARKKLENALSETVSGSTVVKIEEMEAELARLKAEAALKNGGTK